MEIVKDLGLKKVGTRNRHFVLGRCTKCNLEEEMRIDSKLIENPLCRTCRGFKKVTKGKTTTTSEFIKKAEIMHKGTYIYNDSSYERANKKLNVTCKYHGNFAITPNNHLQGKGCPECASIKRGWNRSLYKNAPAALYLVKVNKCVYKIGITKIGVEARYCKDIKDGNIVEILQEHWFINGEDAYDIEKLLLLHTKEHKYMGKNILTHGGNTELRTINCSQLMCNTVKEFHENNRPTVS